MLLNPPATVATVAVSFTILASSSGMIVPMTSAADSGAGSTGDPGISEKTGIGICESVSDGDAVPVIVGVV